MQLSLISISTLIGLAISATSPSAPTNEGSESTSSFFTQHPPQNDYDILFLPADFNYTAYPALNIDIPHQLALLDSGVSPEDLPTLPDEIIAKYTHPHTPKEPPGRHKATSTSDIPSDGHYKNYQTEITCTTSCLSPSWFPTYHNYEKLSRLEKVMCCQLTVGYSCHELLRTMHDDNHGAISWICGEQGVCLPCDKVGSMMLEIVGKCISEEFNQAAEGWMKTRTTEAWGVPAKSVWEETTRFGNRWPWAGKARCSLIDL